MANHPLHKPVNIHVFQSFSSSNYGSEGKEFADCLHPKTDSHFPCAASYGRNVVLLLLSGTWHRCMRLSQRLLGVSGAIS